MRHLGLSVFNPSRIVAAGEHNREGANHVQSPRDLLLRPKLVLKALMIFDPSGFVAAADHNREGANHIQSLRDPLPWPETSPEGTHDI